MGVVLFISAVSATAAQGDRLKLQQQSNAKSSAAEMACKRARVATETVHVTCLHWWIAHWLV